MKLLLDTHAFIWWDSAPDKLSPQARAACQDRTNLLLLSVASAWEMQIKLQLDKLHLRLSLAEVIASQQHTNALQVLPVALNHVFALQALPAHHKDPFDRLLIAQANTEEQRSSAMIRYSPTIRSRCCGEMGRYCGSLSHLQTVREGQCGWKGVQGLPDGMVVQQWVQDDTLPTGPYRKEWRWVAPFARASREDDYRIAWAFFR